MNVREKKLKDKEVNVIKNEKRRRGRDTTERGTAYLSRTLDSSHLFKN